MGWYGMIRVDLSWFGLILVDMGWEKLTVYLLAFEPLISWDVKLDSQLEKNIQNNMIIFIQTKCWTMLRFCTKNMEIFREVFVVTRISLKCSAWKSFIPCLKSLFPKEDQTFQIFLWNFVKIESVTAENKTESKVFSLERLNEFCIKKKN